MIAKSARTHTGLMASAKRREKIWGIFCTFLLVVLSLIVMFPIYWIFRSSLMSNAELFGYPPPLLPPNWRFDNYPAALEAFEYWNLLGNTMSILLPSVIGAVITATMGGYAFARLRFRGKNFLFMLCVGSMLLPTMVTLVPLFIAWSKLGLVGTYWPLILPHFCGGGAFNIFLIRQFIKGIPREMDEAATIDGCGPIRILVSIIVPMISSAMIVVGLLKFIEMWNDLLQQTLYITRRPNYTLALGLNIFKGSFADDWSSIMCATCLSFIPGILFYLVGQKYFVEGIAVTGMKN